VDEAAEPVVRTDSDVASAASIQTGLDFRLNGHDLSGFAFAPVKGRFAASVLAGRTPASEDEVALGANTAAVLHAGAGSTLRGTAENEGVPVVAVRVVGTAVVPPGDVSAHLGDGVMVSRSARPPSGRPGSLALCDGRRLPARGRHYWRHGAPRRPSALDQNFFTQSPATPTDQVNFGQIQNLPFILGSILAVLALLTIAHLLVTSIRRRRRDLAILKTLGFARGDVGRTVAWQATTLAVVALVVAVPLGVALGGWGGVSSPTSSAWPPMW
jgi:hypothetical protein